MSKLLGMICSAAVMLAVTPNAFAQVNSTTTTTTMSTTTKVKDKNFFFKSGMPLDDKDNMPDNKMKYMAGYAAPAAVEVDNSWDMNGKFAYTYWYAGQDAMDVAYVAPVEATGTAGSVVTQDFGYRSGFKIGLGIDTQCDDWAMDIDYTWYNHHKIGATSGAVALNDWFPATAVARTSATGVTSTWSLKMNMVDVAAGRPFYQGKRVVVAPSAGLRVLWLHQNMDIVGGANTFSGESRSWAVGPQATVKTHWMLPGGFRVEGLMGSSVLYTRYTTVSVATTTTAVGTASSAQSKVGTIRPTMDAGMGLGYGAYAFNNKFFFDVSARYDFMQFWSQNVLRNFASQLSGRDDVIAAAGAKITQY
jgi:hypothetical protein